MDAEQWIPLAENRIRKVLNKRRIASMRQLEVKISEAGPYHMRPNPHILTRTLHDMLPRGSVHDIGNLGITSAGSFYTRTRWNPKTSRIDRERKERIKQAYIAFRDVQRADNGEALQTVIQKAIEASDQYNWLNEPGRPPPQETKLSGVPITGHGDLDHYLISKSAGIPLGIEDKNYREWFYPQHKHIKTFLRKCIKYNLLPILITRKVHYTTFRLFSAIGALAFQTHFQIISPKYSNDLADAKHVDGLGFADLRFTDEPLPHMLNYFAKQLPQLLPTFWNRFNSNKRLIERYCDDSISYYELLEELNLVTPKERELEGFFYEY